MWARPSSPEDALERLVFPELASLQLVTGSPTEPRPLPLAGAVFAVHLFASARNDYTLAPFVTDPAGILQITRAACECLMDAAHDAGLMDHAGVGHCSARVEIRLWTGSDVQQAADARRHVWRRLLQGEDRLFRSLEELVAIYDHAPNARLSVSSRALRPIWDGSDPRPSYQYLIDRVAPTSYVASSVKPMSKE